MHHWLRGRTPLQLISYLAKVSQNYPSMNVLITRCPPSLVTEENEFRVVLKRYKSLTSSIIVDSVELKTSATSFICYNYMLHG